MTSDGVILVGGRQPACLVCLASCHPARFRIVMVSHPFIYYNTTQAESENGSETGAVKINLANECIFGREFIEYVYGFKLPGTELCSFYRATPSRINTRKLCVAGDW